ncbi:uncharacterized protein [Lolium perenne]|uniref:uncharacterized protein isoform X2 n=1 Tax=Lolium perenne TaxID=4522 RepID=UPI003A99E25C
MSPNSENTPSAAAEGAMEYDPVVPRADLISISNKQKNDVLVPEFAVASEETGGTSITMALHAARPSIHAAPRLEPAAHTPSGPKTASGPVVSQPTSHGRFDIMHSEGASNPGLSLAVDTVISCKNLPSMAVEDSEKYAQTVLPDTVIDNKAGKKTSTVADVHGTCRSDLAGAGHVALATPTISKPSPFVGSASPMGKGKSFRPGMHGPSKPIQTTPTKTTSIHTVIKHKGAEKNKIVDFGGIEETTMQSVRSSGRLRAQPNYDATQMERARMILQKRDEIPVIGYPTRCSLDSPMGFTSPYGTTGGYGYWMQPDAGGCSGLLFPGFWMATH